MRKRRIYNALLIVLYWVLVVNFLSTFSMFSVMAFLNYAEIEISSVQDTMAIYWISPNQYIEGLLFGVLFGCLFLVVHEISDRFHWDRIGFGMVIIRKSLIYFGGFIIIFLSIYLIIDALGFYPENLWETLKYNPHMGYLMVFIGIFLFVNIVLLNYIIQTNKKIGDNNIISFLTGKYRKPILENRVFMFLDLRSSTSIAEELGNLKYSRLIKDCFEDLNLTIVNYPLDIYQYVGDEVVITGMWNGNYNTHQMVRLYFDFISKLNRKKDCYQEKYSLIPFFKAGIHGGSITTAEIGTIRRDIAFHGDVINTAARIQDLCNELDQKLLVSASTINANDQLNGFEIESMGSFKLRGKHGMTEIVAVMEPSNN